MPGVWAHLGADLAPIAFGISQAVPRVALSFPFSPPESKLCRDSVFQDFPPQDYKHLSLVSLLCLLTSTATSVPRWTYSSLNPLLGISNGAE